jgi:hypothetical protein
MDAALDDAFIDDITFPAVDGYSLTGTLFLPRGAKRHAVLINSATAVPRKIYRRFASYLAHRGCAVVIYDYRVALFGLHRDQAGGADGETVRRRCHGDRPFRLLPPRAPRHAVARRGGMDPGGVIVRRLRAI